LGYWDAAGPVAKIRFPHMSFRVAAPVVHWKQVTLPSPDVQWAVTAFQGFRPYLRASGEVNNDGSANASAEVGYAVTDQIRVGIAGGLIGAPGWRDDLKRFAFVIRLG
jgi:hypothetical protein